MLLSILLSLAIMPGTAMTGSDLPVTATKGNVTPETEMADTLSSVVVTADRGIQVSRADTLSTINSQTITDILLQSPGLMVSDNGGMAGLKTVGLRGLGSTHTAIYIDGIKVGNIQSGQADLAMFGLENFSGAEIDYARNSINFTTTRPYFDNGNVGGKFALTAGSFGTYTGSGRLDFKFSDKLAISANAAGNASKGNFKYGEGQVRENNDIKQIKGGLDFFGLINGGSWTAKAYYNGADRGTPGSISWPSTDRQKDRNAFAQACLKKGVTEHYSLSVSGKASYDDVEYKSEWGDSDYKQTELLLNASNKFNITRWLKMSLVADLEWDGLKSTGYDASRTDVTAIAGAAFKFNRFRANATVQYEGAFDKGGKSRNAVSPAFDLRYIVSDALDITGFARRAYRTPTFNELYYPGYGNPELKPEDATLTDLGIDFHKDINGRWLIDAKIDGFYNYLKDKIVSAPSEGDENIWLPYNIGEVRSAGFDTEANLRMYLKNLNAGLKARYSFQSAENVPFLAKHTAVLSGDVSYKGWAAYAVWNWRGGRKDSYGDMPDWNALDLTAAKSIFKILTLKLSCRNVFDKRYELVTGYPMPGRSLIGGIEIKF